MKKRILITAGIVSVVLVLAWGMTTYEGKERNGIKGDEVVVDAFGKKLFEEYIPIDKATELLTSEIIGENEAFMDNFVGLFLSRLETRAAGLNTSFRMFNADLKYYVGNDVKKLDSSIKTDDYMIEAIIKEIESPYFMVSGSTMDEAEIRVDYGYVAKTYGKALTKDFNNRLELLEYSNQYRYRDSKDGRPNFENTYKRYEKIMEMQSREENKGSIYLMGEAYDTYYALLGIGSFGMNTAEGVKSEIALAEMAEFATSREGTEVGNDIKQLIESINSEGKYGEQTEDIARRIIEERFNEFLKLMEDELGE